MIKFIVLLGALFSGAPALLSAANVLAFERDNAVWVAKIDGSEARKIAEGAAPDYAVRKAIACARQHPDTVAQARALGVPITAGSDSGSPGAPHPALFAELRDLVARGGLTPLEAITAATTTNARALGLEAAIGTLAPGRQADLLVVDGDPANDITALERVWAVMQAGEWVRW